MTHRIGDIEYEIVALASHITAALGRSAKDPSRLEESAYTLLTLIDSGGPASIGELHQVLGLDPSTLNRQTAALVRNGLVERRGDSGGGVARRFHLTALGRTRLEAEQGASRGALAETLRSWPPEQRADLTRTLRALNAAVEERYSRPWPRREREAPPGMG